MIFRSECLVIVADEAEGLRALHDVVVGLLELAVLVIDFRQLLLQLLFQLLHLLSLLQKQILRIRTFSLSYEQLNRFSVAKVDSLSERENSLLSYLSNRGIGAQSRSIEIVCQGAQDIWVSLETRT